MKIGTSYLPSLRVVWNTPIGTMTGEITDSGLRMLHFPPLAELSLNGSDHQPVEILTIEWQGEGKPGTNLLATAERVTACLQNYFDGEAIDYLPEFDWRGSSAFDQQVWKATAGIPMGETITYGQLAAAIGRPGAARAVGGALGRNPLVLLVPCHRVLATSSGTRRLGGFTGGLPLKEHLLKMESKRKGGVLVQV